MESTSSATAVLTRRERREAAERLRATGELPVTAVAPSPAAPLRLEIGDTGELPRPAVVVDRADGAFVSRRQRRALAVAQSAPTPLAPTAPSQQQVFGAPTANRGPSALGNAAPRPLVRADRVVVPAAAAPVVVGPACEVHDEPTVTPAQVPPAGHVVTEVSAGDLPEPREPVRGRWVPRAAVLTSLAVATIAVPIVTSGSDGAASGAEGGGPSLLDAVTATPAGIDAPTGVRALERTSDRDTAASRSESRSSLENCDPDVIPKGSNGELDKSQLCELWQKGYYLAPDAAVSLSAFNDAYKARFGKDLCLVAAYRPLSEQYKLAVTRAGYAAVPGTSNHGLGLAVDLCSSVTGNATEYQWVRANAPTYGWNNPAWARAGGSGAYEPWHFELVQAVLERGIH